MKKNLLWTNKMFVFFFNCPNWETFVEKLGETKLVVWWFDVTKRYSFSFNWKISVKKFVDLCSENSWKHVMNWIIVDKIYTDVWTTPSALNPSTRQVPVNNSSRPPSATPSSITSRPASAAAANTSTTSIGGPQTRPSSTGMSNPSLFTRI